MYAGPLTLLLLAPLLSGCFSGAVERADKSLGARISDLEAAADRTTLQAAEAAKEAALEVTGEVREVVAEERKLALEHVERVLTAKIADVDERATRLLEQSLPQAAGKAAEAATGAVLARLDDWAAPKPPAQSERNTGDPTQPPGDPDRWELWAGVVALALTAGKTAWRYWRRKGAEEAAHDARRAS